MFRKRTGNGVSTENVLTGRLSEIAIDWFETNKMIVNPGKFNRL